MGLLEPTFRRTQTFRHNAAAYAAAMSIAMQAAQEPYWCGKEEAGPHGQTSTGATCKTVCNVAPRETDSSPTRRRQGIGPQVELSEDG